MSKLRKNAEESDS